MSASVLQDLPAAVRAAVERALARGDGASLGELLATLARSVYRVGIVRGRELERGQLDRAFKDAEGLRRRRAALPRRRRA